MLKSASIEKLKITNYDLNKINSNLTKNGVLKRLNDYGKLINKLKNEDSELVKINRVNQFFNKFKSVKDKKNYKKADYWATRKEFILKGSGDCEDYVIAKYFTLIDLGISPNKLTPILGKYKKQPHLVLSYRSSKQSLILDNINKKVLPLKLTRNFKREYSIKPFDVKSRDKMSFKIASYKWHEILEKY